jgi:hypothetical protein
VGVSTPLRSGRIGLGGIDPPLGHYILLKTSMRKSARKCLAPGIIIAAALLIVPMEEATRADESFVKKASRGKSQYRVAALQIIKNWQILH